VSYFNKKFRIIQYQFQENILGGSETVDDVDDGVMTKLIGQIL
jgi:hypothetical protein